MKSSDIPEWLDKCLVPTSGHNPNSENIRKQTRKLLEDILKQPVNKEIIDILESSKV